MCQCACPTSAAVRLCASTAGPGYMGRGGHTGIVHTGIRRPRRARTQPGDTGAPNTPLVRRGGALAPFTHRENWEIP